uniref:Uncharacterized protein n=1 Tax=Trichogramma kaykai TaxID=54128 RepID=A0ABD2XDD3_9HYME
MRLTTTTTTMSSERRSETKRPPFSFSLRYKQCKRRTARNPVTIRDVALVIKIPLARLDVILRTFEDSPGEQLAASDKSSRKLSELNITYPRGYAVARARPCWRPQRQRRLRRFATIMYCIYVMFKGTFLSK